MHLYILLYDIIRYYIYTMTTMSGNVTWTNYGVENDEQLIDLSKIMKLYIILNLKNIDKPS